MSAVICANGAILKRIGPHKKRAAEIFADYRLRVARVMCHYGLNERAEAPSDSATVHDPL